MKKKILIEVVCVLLLLVLMCALAAMALFTPNYNFEETVYQVQSGDCLWDIADEYCPKSMDKWDYIWLIQERNDLSDSTIYPGQVIIVLVQK